MSETRELPSAAQASVDYLKSMGYDAAADCLRNGWFGPEPDDEGSDRG